MKLSKKIIVTLLAAIILVSSVVVSAFAADPVDVDNIEGILEFYTSRDFFSEDYEKNEVGKDYTYYCGDCSECGAALVGIISGKRKTQYYVCPNSTRVLSAAEATCTNTTQTKATDLLGEISFMNLFGDLTGTVEKTVVADGDNQVLEIINMQKNDILYTVKPSVASESLIITYRVKTDNYEFYKENVTDAAPPEGDAIEPAELINGAKISIKLSVYDEDQKGYDEFYLFQMDLNPANEAERTISYMGYDPDSPISDLRYPLQPMKDPADPTANLIPRMDQWYTITAAVNFNTGVYNVDIVPDGGEKISTGNQTLGNLKNSDAINLQVFDNGRTGTKIWFDDIKMYEGTFVRHDKDAEQYVSDTIIALYDMLKSDDTAADIKIRIVDVFKAMFVDIDGTGAVYTTTDATPNKDKVEAIIAEATETLINKTYADVFIAFVDQLADIDNYYDKIVHCENKIVKFDELFAGAVTDTEDPAYLDDDAFKAEFPGIVDVDAVRAAKTAYTEAVKASAMAKVHSEAYLELVKDFDDTNLNYVYMVDYINALKVFDKRAPEYKYEIIGQIPAPDGEGTVEGVRFATVADGDKVLLALEAKVASIDAAVAAFIDAVDVMDGAENFAVLYEGYVDATAAFNGGVITPVLDNSTYPGLLASIDAYSAQIAYMDNRIEESVAFITLVNGANSSTFYTTILGELDKAEEYIDTNTAELHAEPDYPGVAEAKTTYNTLRAKLADDVKNAEKYINAVKQLEGVTGYAAKKAAVDAALALREKGNVIGIEGILEANNALSVAEGEIKVLEGYSATLINAVKSLEGATDLATRRELIAVANDAKDKVEGSIAGVTDAKTKLDGFIAAYNAEIEALNSAFSSAVANAAAASSAITPATGAYINADVIKEASK